MGIGRLFVSFYVIKWEILNVQNWVFFPSNYREKGKENEENEV